MLLVAKIYKLIDISYNQKQFILSLYCLWLKFYKLKYKFVTTFDNPHIMQLHKN